MRVVYKYPLPNGGNAHLDVPEGAEWIGVRVGSTNGEGQALAIVETDNPTEHVVLSVRNTGQELRDDMKASSYIGSFFTDRGVSEAENYLGHVFKRTDHPAIVGAWGESR